ncbi:uncharacterized protein [Spinacia oleracea]|uniref:Reverse transcriptase domain-containing protein n=1 Tax=Spinacia oleracea TaxID=3562 RepID=A0ABM3RSV3_SPIOL|nr:uncharacterized protein LOC110799803 [Spinacia oleracea]
MSSIFIVEFMTIRGILSFTLLMFLDVQDRVNGAPVSWDDIKDFSECVGKCQLFELKSSGHLYSWHKGGDVNKTASRIDRCFGNGDLMSERGSVFSEYLNPSLSDHSPIIIKCISEVKGVEYHLGFFNYLVDHLEFLSLVERSWKDPVEGSVMFSVWEKLKRIQHSDDSLLREEHNCTTVQRKWLNIEEIALRQKSRLQWLNAGDSNNKFFFDTVKERHRVNRISKLTDDNNNKLVKPDEIQAEFLKFYGALLGTSVVVLPIIDPTMRARATLIYSDISYLCQPVTDVEIDLAMQGIDGDKAPGIDGFNAIFFKKTWKVIKIDVYAIVKDFFAHKAMLAQVNSTTITLVPKVPNPYKVKKVVGSIVSDCQAGFIPGRHISVNILLATELVKGYNRKHISPRCMIKYAYDSIEWIFLMDVMRDLGFPALFTDWILACISSVSYIILINGKP